MADLTQREVDAIYALRHASEWVYGREHGDNCFVSDHYPGDPGNRCNCGKQSLLDAIHSALDGYPEQTDDDGVWEAEQKHGAPPDAEMFSIRNLRRIDTAGVTLEQRFADVLEKPIGPEFDEALRQYIEEPMNLRDWLDERQQNAENLARLRPQDAPGWLEDADYRRALSAELARLKRPRGLMAGPSSDMPDHEVASVLCNLSQLLNAVEEDWKTAGRWSDWDAQTVQNFLAYKGRLLADIERRTADVKTLGEKQ